MWLVCVVHVTKLLCHPWFLAVNQVPVLGEWLVARSVWLQYLTRECLVGREALPVLMYYLSVKVDAIRQVDARKISPYPLTLARFLRACWHIAIPRLQVSSLKVRMWVVMLGSMKWLRLMLDTDAPPYFWISQTYDARNSHVVYTSLDSACMHFTLSQIIAKLLHVNRNYLCSSQHSSCG